MASLSKSALYIPQAIVSAMLDHARKETPQECVGLLFGSQNRIRRRVGCHNVAIDAKTAFMAKAEEVLAALKEADANNEELLAIYHSHPQGPQTPSATDLQEAHYDAASVIIVPEPAIVRAFWLQRHGYQEVDLVIDRN